MPAAATKPTPSRIDFFENMQKRVVEIVRFRISGGEFTERGLARRLGVSQPHLHNVLKGVRTLKPHLADRIIVAISIPFEELLQPAQAAGRRRLIDVEELKKERRPHIPKPLAHQSFHFSPSRIPGKNV